MANEEHLAILKQGIEAYNEWRESHSEVWPDLAGADLREMNLVGANLRGANLSGANLSGADLGGADFALTNFNGANLREASLRYAQFVGTTLIQADLSGADLSYCKITNANFESTILDGCLVQNISAWNLKLEKASQKGLFITPNDEFGPVVTVDSLEIAQFLSLMLDPYKFNTAEIRDFITTINTKLVLIAGRFVAERQATFDKIKESLHTQSFLPVILDFRLSGSRMWLEKIFTLTRMAHFIIADLTDLSSYPLGLTRAIPSQPYVPVQPSLLASRQEEYNVFKDWFDYPWVQEIFLYKDEQHLLDNLEAKVIQPAVSWKNEQKTVELLKLQRAEDQRKIKELQKELERLKGNSLED